MNHHWLYLLTLCVTVACSDPEPLPVPDEPIDNDGDGFAEADDCDDWSAAVNPGATEVCDEQDNDCDGQVDENVMVTFYNDIDNDGYGVDTKTIQDCWQLSDDGNWVPPDGYASNVGDCDNFDPTTHPGILFDTCDEADNDCDGDIDEDDPPLDYYIDGDGDGFGTTGIAQNTCDPPFGYAPNTDDCDDNDGLTNPDAPERCDGEDNNCNGKIDDKVVKVWYPDNDGDGFGDSAQSTKDCNPPANYFPIGEDCNDTDPNIYPGGVELCDTIDNNCNALIDEESCYTEWEGAARFEYGVFNVPTQRDCEYDWNSYGERTPHLCANCEFAFEVQYTLDTKTAANNGACDDWTNFVGDPLEGDFVYRWGYTSDYVYNDYYHGPISYGPAMMIDVGDNTWYPIFSFINLTLDDSGKLSYRYGYQDYPYNNAYYTYWGEDIGYLD